MSDVTGESSQSRPPDGSGPAHQPGGHGTAPGPVSKIGIAAGVLAFVALGVTAMVFWPDEESSNPGNSAPSAQPAPATPADTPATARYKALDKPCSAVDWRPLTTLVGPTGGDVVQDRAVGGGLLTTMICQMRVGDPDNRGQANMQVSVFEGLPAQSMYDGMRRVAEDDGQLTQIPNLGVAAYTYTDQALGPYVVAWTGNLHISAGWAADTKTANVNETDVISALTEVVRQTIERFKA